MAKKRDDSGMQSKLMNAAMTAFSRKGLNDCRMSDIADAAGLARGTAYLYFRSKEQLMLMLEPLFRCNLACAGCGKIQYPEHVLNRRLTPEQCWAAAQECGTPMVAIPGGEPLIHPEIDKIVSGFVARKKYIYLCTNALL